MDGSEPLPASAAAPDKGAKAAAKGPKEKTPRESAGASRARAPPKKGGAGAKTVWGKPGDEEGGIPAEKDLLYDSNEEFDEDAARREIDEVAARAGPSGMYDAGERAVRHVPSLSDFKARVIAALEEYFSSQDIGEAVLCIDELACPLWHYEVVKRAITMSLDRKDRERELSSKLLSSLFGAGVLNSDQVGKGFTRLFEQADDLALDVPDAKARISQFLSRAVVDEVLPPAFLTDPMVKGLGGAIVDDAVARLSQRHGAARVEQIFNGADERTVEDLKREIKTLLQEYVLSRDDAEASRCLRDLSCPLFHHEVVKRALTLAMDADEAGRAALVGILTTMTQQELISSKQMIMGYNRLISELHDLRLDVPAAPRLLAEFAQAHAAARVLPASIAALCARLVGGAAAAATGAAAAAEASGAAAAAEA